MTRKLTKSLSEFRHVIVDILLKTAETSIMTVSSQMDFQYLDRIIRSKVERFSQFRGAFRIQDFHIRCHVTRVSIAFVIFRSRVLRFDIGWQAPKIVGDFEDVIDLNRFGIAKGRMEVSSDSLPLALLTQCFSDIRNQPW